MSPAVKPSTAYSLNPALLSRPLYKPPHKVLIVRNPTCNNVFSPLENLNVKPPHDLFQRQLQLSGFRRRRERKKKTLTSGNNLNISMYAISLPMHILGPMPNENCTASSSFDLFSLSNHLSGRNSFASSP